jgi:predicted HAD superfamily phosphohydrolase YqeG
MIKNIPDQIKDLRQLKYLDMWSNNLSKISENIKLLTKLEELDLRVIMLSNKEKNRIKNLLPNTKVHFSNSCNCGY